MHPDPAQPGETIDVALTVGNRGALPLSAETVQARVPQNVLRLLPSLTTGGGTSPPYYCDLNELVTWTLNPLPGERLGLEGDAKQPSQARPRSMDATAPPSRQLHKAF
jgi:hypothetical protein